MKKTYNIENLECTNCAMKIENGIKNNIDGVISANVNFLLQKMTVEFDDKSDNKAIFKQILNIAKKVEPDCEITEKN